MIPNDRLLSLFCDEDLGKKKRKPPAEEYGQQFQEKELAGL